MGSPRDAPVLSLVPSLAQRRARSRMLGVVGATDDWVAEAQAIFSALRRLTIRLSRDLLRQSSWVIVVDLRDASCRIVQ